jgi:hypothetical protein
MIDVYIISIILAMVFFYSIAKERQELGCYRVSIDRQCIDDESVYVKNTKMSSNDSCEDLVSRMTSIISYHEKGGVWKRCLIIAAIIVAVVYVVYNMNSKFDNIYHYLVILLLIFALLYFYHNYINYHHFRILKHNGVEILENIKHHCFKK